MSSLSGVIATRCSLVLLVISIMFLDSTLFNSNGNSQYDVQFDFKQHRPTADKIKQATQVRLYEGLPHQVNERKLWEQEMKTGKSMTLHDFPFYQEMLPLKSDDATRLTALFGDEKAIQPYQGVEKLPDGRLVVAGRACGGFHPDYCIEWIAQGATYQLLVCFGCGEARCYGPKRVLWFDFDRPAFDSVLGKYRKNRPERKKV